MALVNKTDLFEIKINFKPNSGRASGIFRAMSDIIEALYAIDKDLVRSFSVTIEPKFILEDIEVGSIKARIRTILEDIDDEGLKELDWKKIVGNFLVKGKYFILDFLKDKKGLTSIEEVQTLEETIMDLAKQTDVQSFPFYSSVQRKNLLQNLSSLYDATKHLSENDTVSYISSHGEVEIMQNFRISNQTIEEILTRETRMTESEMTLRVKKPDYLGTSKWDMQFNGKIIPVKIVDYEWLERFQQRSEDVRPGDSLRCIVQVHVNYGYDNFIVSEHYVAKKILEVIQSVQWEQITWQ